MCLFATMELPAGVCSSNNRVHCLLGMWFPAPAPEVNIRTLESIRQHTGNTVQAKSWNTVSPPVSLKTRTSCHDMWTDTQRKACHRQRLPHTRRTPLLCTAKIQLRSRNVTENRFLERYLWYMWYETLLYNLNLITQNYRKNSHVRTKQSKLFCK